MTIALEYKATGIVQFFGVNQIEWFSQDETFFK